VSIKADAINDARNDILFPIDNSGYLSLRQILILPLFNEINDIILNGGSNLREIPVISKFFLKYRINFDAGILSTPKGGQHPGGGRLDLPQRNRIASR
jgi:hypothetical protein